LAIPVHRPNELAAGDGKPSRQSGGFAPLAAQPEQADAMRRETCGSEQKRFLKLKMELT
jgi:hypothetical protein